MTNHAPVLAVTEQVLTDDFGYIIKFPYNINSWTIKMTLKKTPATQTDAQADAQQVVTPSGVTPDSDGFYNVTLVIPAAEVEVLDPVTYFFDIVTKDTGDVVNHIISPRSTVSFIGSNTLDP